MHGIAQEFQPRVWLNVHSGMEAMFTPWDHKAEVGAEAGAEAEAEAGAEVGVEVGAEAEAGAEVGVEAEVEVEAEAEVGVEAEVEVEVEAEAVEAGAEAGCGRVWRWGGGVGWGDGSEGIKHEVEQPLPQGPDCKHGGLAVCADLGTGAWRVYRLRSTVCVIACWLCSSSARCVGVTVLAPQPRF